MPVSETVERPRPPEVLDLGTVRRSRPWLRWVVLGVVLAVAAPLAHVALWWATRPPADFTLGQLQDAYYGMVRSDGSNDLSTFEAATAPAGDAKVVVSPDRCAALFTPTVANRVPAGVADGVSTYWLNQGTTSISLFTLRYPTTAAATAAYAVITGALDGCVGATVTFGDAMSGGLVRAVPVTPSSGVATQVAYLLDRGDGSRFAFHAMLLSNTVSWQFRYVADAANAGSLTGRYDAGAGGARSLTSRYDGQASQQLMDGLALQLLAVRPAR